MSEQMGQQVPTTEDPYKLLEQLLNFEKYDVQRVELTQVYRQRDPVFVDLLDALRTGALSESQRAAM